MLQTLQRCRHFIRHHRTGYGPTMPHHLQQLFCNVTEHDDVSIGRSLECHQHGNGNIVETVSNNILTSVTSTSALVPAAAPAWFFVSWLLWRQAPAGQA